MRLKSFSPIYSRGPLRTLIQWYKLNLRFRGTWGVGTLLFLGCILFLAFFVTNTIVFGSPGAFSPPPNYKIDRRRDRETCEHTQQGKVYITDDRGSICTWKDLNPTTSCCKDYSITKLQLFSCENCNKTIACCSIYEFCVSCCMDPNKEDLRNEVIESTETKGLGFGDPSVLSPFDYCRCLCSLSSIQAFIYKRAMCRTSSKSIYSHNQYRNDDKYCYSLNAPPVQNRTDEGNMNRIKIAETQEQEIGPIKRSQEQESPLNEEEEEEEEVLLKSASMNVGDGERNEQKKTKLFGIFSNAASSMDIAHQLRLCLLAFLVYFIYESTP